MNAAASSSRLLPDAPPHRGNRRSARAAVVAGPSTPVDASGGPRRRALAAAAASVRVRPRPERCVVAAAEPSSASSSASSASSPAGGAPSAQALADLLAWAAKSDVSVGATRPASVEEGLGLVATRVMAGGGRIWRPFAALWLLYRAQRNEGLVAEVGAQDNHRTGQGVSGALPRSRSIRLRASQSSPSFAPGEGPGWGLPYARLHKVDEGCETAKGRTGRATGKVRGRGPGEDRGGGRAPLAPASCSLVRATTPL